MIGLIGLHKNTVEVVEHRSGWSAIALEACEAVSRVGAELLIDVQHVGSTAVPDIPAKPVVDLAAGIRTLQTLPKLRKRLETVGYLYCGDGGDEGGHFFVKESVPNVRTLHLHVVEYNQRQWNNYLLFRDLLRQNQAIRRQYGLLKQQLKRQHPNNRNAYTGAKHQFITSILNTHTSPQNTFKTTLSTH